MKAAGSGLSVSTWGDGVDAFFFNCLFPAERITLWRVNDKIV